jgi:opacity protein-like surface antigen
MGDVMKKNLIAALVIAAVFASSTAQSAPPIFKEKKYFGPMPFNGFSLNVGFLDGADFSYLTEALNNWAEARYGYDTFKEMPLAPSWRLSYERKITPNHVLKLSSTFTYITQESNGEYVAEYPDTNYALQILRTIKVYLLSLEAGFSYYFVTPEPQRFSPYAGAGFAAVIPMVRLKTDSFLSGRPFSNPGETISQNSFQAGLHMEFGVTYFLSNRYALGFEGKYQMAQSKFDIHGGNFDLRYTGLILSLGLTYYL